MSKILALF